MDAARKAASGSWHSRCQTAPTISSDGEPNAEKILLFAKLSPVAAVPSARVGVPVRLRRGDTGTGYSADYRQARQILSASLPESFEARQRAYLLLKTRTGDLQTVGAQVRDLP